MMDTLVLNRQPPHRTTNRVWFLDIVGFRLPALNSGLQGFRASGLQPEEDVYLISARAYWPSPASAWCGGHGRQSFQRADL